MLLKQLILLHWYDRHRQLEPWRIFKKSWARWRRHGYGGMRERLEREYRELQEDYLLFHRWGKRYDTLRLRLLFEAAFVVTAGYYMLVKSELYESGASVVVRDLNKQVVSELGLGLLGAGVGSQTQDAKILEEYLASPDLLRILDAKFDLEGYYRSDTLDPLSRLLPSATREDLLEVYRRDLNVVYDELSGILRIGFRHTDPGTAREVLTFLIAEAERQLNRYNERNAQKQLAFVRGLVEQNRRNLDAATEELETYQNEQLILDPAADVQSRSAIIADLEGRLVQKRAEYNQMKRYMSEKSFDLVKLNNEIREIKAALKRAKSSLSGSDKERLNAVLFAFERLKARVAFEQEVYKESLVQLEVAKVDANKQAKVLVVLTEPNLPDGYSYPDKPRLFLTLVVVFLLLYGIVSLVTAIIKDHKD